MNLYSSEQVADRIKSFAKARGLQLKDILEVCGLARTTMGNMRAGSMPKADNLAKIAKQLDCSVDYLLGLTDDPQRPPDKNSPASDQERDELVHAALAGTGLLSDDGLLTKEGAQIIAQFLNQNSIMLKKLMDTSAHAEKKEEKED